MIPLATYRFHLNGDDYECIISKEDSPTRHLFLCANGVHEVWPSAGEIIQFKIYDNLRRPKRDEKPFRYYYSFGIYGLFNSMPRIVFDEQKIDLEIHDEIANELSRLGNSHLWIELEDLTPKQKNVE